MNLRPAAAVAWHPSTGLLLAEVVTGGTSAFDEYVEITNAGALPVDLAGMERVYVTSLGSSVTRKVAWTDVTSLTGFLGRSVRVGGLVVTVDATSLALDDGTGTARLELAGDARPLLSLLSPGDAIGAAGIVQTGSPTRIRVAEAADLVRLGDLGEAVPSQATTRRTLTQRRRRQRVRGTRPRPARHRRASPVDQRLRR